VVEIRASRFEKLLKIGILKRIVKTRKKLKGKDEIGVYPNQASKP